MIAGPAKSRGAAVAVALAMIASAAAQSVGATTPPTVASKCVSRGGLPDLRCTPGALNRRVKQSNIRQTICVPHYTDGIRPPTSYTNKLKTKGINDYGFADTTLGHYEEDHLIPLAVGGSPRSPRNLWPERYAGKWGARIKDKLERRLHDRVCDGAVRLSTARRAFRNWKAAFQRFGL
jgi:hypothetical protein